MADKDYSEILIDFRITASAVSGQLRGQGIDKEHRIPFSVTTQWDAAVRSVVELRAYGYIAPSEADRVEDRIIEHIAKTVLKLDGVL